MKKFGLIGFPLSHSFSKKYFNDKFSKENLSGFSYENYPISSPEQINTLIASESDLYGLNVTIPYKVPILGFVDELSEEVKEIGAANVLKISRFNNTIHIKAFNSDVSGFIDSIKPLIRNWNKPAIILGSGGASKAVNYGLKKMAIETITVSRSKTPDTITYSELTDEILNQSEIIVNTTSLGMYPDVMSSPDINYSVLNKSHLLYDLVYNPELTRFLEKGKEQGCTIINGLKMLHLQAEKSWEIWNSNDIL